MIPNTLYQILGRVEWDIRECYTGGAVDVFINHNGKDGDIIGKKEKLYYYDVNSLYPTVMANIEMPVGKPVALEGNLFEIWKADKDSKNKFMYFLYCNITSPAYLEHPILQRRIKTAPKKTS